MTSKIVEKDGFEITVSKNNSGSLVAQTVLNLQDHKESITVLEDGGIIHYSQYFADKDLLFWERVEPNENNPVIKALKSTIQEHKGSSY